MGNSKDNYDQEEVIVDDDKVKESIKSIEMEINDQKKEIANLQEMIIHLSKEIDETKLIIQNQNIDTLEKEEKENE